MKGMIVPPELWQRVKSIVSTALDMDPEAWPGYLEESCGSDAELLAEARSLLEVSWSLGNFIEEPLPELLRQELTRGRASA
ncbi:MAG TPA: hypothetical protein VGG06_28895 [Thermoanaerobaculia bacterium]|jgi:hypothetical protein